MTAVKKYVITSVVLAGISVLFQTISFIIPGWFIIETRAFSLNMALWFVIICDSGLNGTTSSEACGTISYKRLFSEQRGQVISSVGTSFSSTVSTQVQVTSCLILATGALLLILFQFKTFLQQTTGQPTIFENEPRGTCNLREKFIYSGGFSAIFQMFSGILLGLVILDFSKRYFAVGKPRPHVPYTLFVAGIGSFCSGLCGMIELGIAFRTKEDRRRRPSDPGDKHCSPQQLIPLNEFQGHGQEKGHHHESHVRELSLDDGDYYGHDYDVENPAFRSQGLRKSDASSSLFPGYKLGKQNLRGHDKKWWRKVTFAAL